MPENEMTAATRLVPSKAFVESVEAWQTANTEREDMTLMWNAMVKRVSEKQDAVNALLPEMRLSALSSEAFAQGYRAAEAELQPRLAAYEAEEARCRQLIGKADSDQPLCSLLYDRLVFQGIEPAAAPADARVGLSAMIEVTRLRDVMDRVDDNVRTMRQSGEMFDAAADKLLKLLECEHGSAPNCCDPCANQLLATRAPVRELTDADYRTLARMQSLTGPEPVHSIKEVIAKADALRGLTRETK